MRNGPRFLISRKGSWSRRNNQKIISSGHKRKIIFGIYLSIVDCNNLTSIAWFRSDRAFKDMDIASSGVNDPRLAYITMCNDQKIVPRAGMLIRQ